MKLKILEQIWAIVELYFNDPLVLLEITDTRSVRNGYKLKFLICPQDDRCALSRDILYDEETGEVLYKDAIIDTIPMV